MGSEVSYSIRKATPADVPGLVEMIRAAFRDVALRFDLSADNCPRHPSNCQESWVASALEQGVSYFLLASEGIFRGCVALEQANSETCYLERLAVLPPWRHRGHGRALIAHALAEARTLGVQRVEIGIIAEHLELRDWYRKIGFVDQRTTRSPHLPFQVLFMSLGL